MATALPVLKAVVPLVTAVGTVASAYSSIQQAKEAKKTPATIAPASPMKEKPVMPTADDEALRAARRRSIVEQLSRGGRQSTILTAGGNGGSPTLG